MAADVPDAQSLKSWQEAFQHPIPTVRRVEQELRRDITSNREKLRSLVGVRYRDLLDTAQTIVGMNDEIQEVETHLSNISRQCNPRLIEKKAEHGIHDKGADDRAIAAQLALLHNCTTTGYRLFRKHGSNLLVAKLLVISRLLHKTLSQSNRAPVFLDNLRSQLASLRRSLLKRIDRRLSSPASTTQDMVQTMSAYCLATSSSSNDVLRHFHQVRLEAIESLLQKEDPTFANVEQSINLFIHTLKRTSDLLSGSLSDALGKLTTHPILDDPEVRNLDALGTDIFKRWVANDIKNFTPWVKQLDLSKAETAKTIKGWSRNAFEQLTDGMSKNLQQGHNFKDILLLRKNLLEIWLPVQSSTPCHSSLDILEGIRNTINRQLVSTLRTQAKGLTLLGLEISSTITSWSDAEEHVSASSLWDADVTFLDFSDGATPFKQEIINRTLGKDSNVLQISASYHTWLSSAENCKDMIDELQGIRWEDVIEDDEDEDVLENAVGTLKQDDPNLLQKEYGTTLEKTFSALQTSLHGALANMTGLHRGRQAAFLLRVIREIRGSLPRGLSTGDHLFADDLVPKLHDILAAEINSAIPASNLTRTIGKRGGGCAGRSLWEGDPQLPIQPSPAVFRLLQKLVTAMEQQGPDLWNASAVDTLKVKLRKTISSCIQSGLEGPEPPPKHETSQVEDSPEDSTADNDDDTAKEPSEPAPVEPAPDVIRDRKIQLLFDVLYLDDALTVRQVAGVEENDLRPIIEFIKKDIESDEDIVEALRKRSQEYWKQTQLLFGLLG
ncbi:hypothetical protein FQN50_006858 [Emmonsiellopsis sp. PD_5]|nr:hypothetical protein FQN50_006858 [Emmonsiellopsis sp. PD_5]